MKNFSICLVVIFCLLLFEVLSADQTLQNIDEIYLKVSKSEYTPEEVDTSFIRNKVELELRKFGFKIIEELLDTTNIYVGPNILSIDIRVITDDNNLYIYNIGMGLYRYSVIVSHPYYKTYGKFWDASYNGRVSYREPFLNTLNKTIDKLVTSFLNDYLKANNNKQPDELSLSTQNLYDYFDSTEVYKLVGLAVVLKMKNQWILPQSIYENVTLFFLQAVSHSYIKLTPKEELMKLKDSLTQVYNLPKRNLQADIDSLKKEGLFPEQKEKED